MANKYENIGLLASLLGVINFYILVYHNYQEQDTSSLAPLWLLISSLIQILWFIYGYVNKLIPVYINSPLILLLMNSIRMLALYRKKRSLLSMNFELTKKVAGIPFSFNIGAIIW